MSNPAGKTRDTPKRADYRWFTGIETRWMDNDIYGHVNNVAYYSFFDTAANRFLIEHGQLDIQNDSVVGFVVASACQYHAPSAFPETLSAGVRVDTMSSRSVTYGIALFGADAESARAHGHFVHVFVDRRSNRAVDIPETIRDALQTIRVPNGQAS